MFEALSKALADTAASAFIANHFWITPLVQSVHILAISALSGSLLMLCLRLSRLSRQLTRQLTLPEMDVRFSGWIWWPAVVLTLTGLVLVVGEPDRELMNVLFRLKIVLVVTLLALVLLFQQTLRRDRRAWTGRGGPTLALLIGLLLMAIVTAGRWIAYI